MFTFRSHRSLRRTSLVGALVVLAAWTSADPAPADTNPIVVLETSMGAIRIELDPAKAPLTVENFKKYVKGDFYTGTIFHRVIDNFMIQGGGYTEAQKEKLPMFPPIALESRNGLKNLKGTVAMARTSDPKSATCQFFINVVDNPNLDYPKPDGHGYTVFGHVVSGMDVVQKIQVTKVVDRGGAFASAPETPIVIKSARFEGEPR